MKKNYMVLDVETTGFSPKKDNIIEVAFAIVDSETFEVIRTYTNLVRITSRTIPSKITELTGITTEMCLLDGENRERVIEDVRKELENSIFVAHNAKFDANFIEQDFGLTVNRDEMIDTMQLSRTFDSQFKSHKLGVICERHGINLEGAHRGLNDVLATVEVLKLFTNQEV